MAYTATKSGKGRSGRNITLTLTILSDGTPVETIPLLGDTLTNEYVEGRARNAIASWELADTNFAALTEGAVTLDADPYETVAAPFFAAQEKLVAVNQATAEGLLKGTEQADAAAAYKAAYAAVESAGFMEQALSDPRYKR